MKRQHPTDPNLFWCPKCKTYKARVCFHVNKSLFNGVAKYCKECFKIFRDINYSRHIDDHRKRAIANGKTQKHKSLVISYMKRRREALKDPYIIEKLNRQGAVITTETIELKRQQITAKRTLRQFKQWRKENENESNHTDVHGKQFTDEENHEGRV